MYILEIQNVTRRFLSVTALNKININLKRGEIHAICGENGAGKSTLMKIISGSDAYGNYEGKIIINGEEKKLMSTKDGEKNGIEMIYQEISLHLDLSVAENLFLGNLPQTKYRTVDWKAMSSSAREYLDAVNLFDVSPTQAVRSLSTSQQQLLSIARAIAKKPQILVLDEPTSALTKQETKNLLNIMRNLSKNGVACLYISHKLEEVFEISDRVTVIRDGAHIATYNTADVNEDIIICDMVGRSIDNLFPKVSNIQEDVVYEVDNLVVPHPFMMNANIIDGVSFKVKKGEVLGIAGLVGAGRSELLNALFKADTNNVSGNTYLEGKCLNKLSISQIKEAGIGYITEDRKKSGIIANHSIKNNSTIASLKKISKRFVINSKSEKEIAKDYFDKLQIKAPSINTHVVNLSGGNQQKVILAKWLMTDMKVIFFDEPTRGIDVGAKVEIYNLINELSKQGVAVIMVSSEMPELIAMSDRILVLCNGKFTGEFTREEVTQEKIMKCATSVSMGS